MMQDALVRLASDIHNVKSSDTWLSGIRLYEKLIDSKLSYVLCTDPIRSDNVCGDGDVLVGFFSDTETIITVSIADTFVSHIPISPGQFRYAFDDSFVIPKILLRFHQIKITTTDNTKPKCIFMCCTNDLRKSLFNWAYMKRSHDYLRIESGMMSSGSTRGNTKIELYTMRNLPIVCDTMVLPKQVELLKHLSHKHNEYPLSLKLEPEILNTIWATGVVNTILLQTCWSPVGNMVTVGNSLKGMHTHKDEGYQGGTHSLLIYLTDVERGGETIFSLVGRDILTVTPKAGRVCIFPVSMTHRANPVIAGEKYLVACEVVIKKYM